MCIIPPVAFGRQFPFSSDEPMCCRECGGAVYPLALNVSLLLALCCPRGTELLVTIALVWVCDFRTVCFGIAVVSHP